MKKLLLLFAFLFLLSSSLQAIVAYNQTNEQTQVRYDSSSTADQLSVVSVNGGSAVYLGNGWFITANHVPVSVNSLVVQNGSSSKISYIDNSLNASYGVDLKMFYCDNLNALNMLTSVAVASEPYSVISGVQYGYQCENILSPYQLTTTLGSKVSLVGAGNIRSQSDNSGDALTSTTITTTSSKGTIHFGTSHLYETEYKDEKNNTYLITMAETTTASAQAQDRDSGSGMFYEFEGEIYLLDLTTNVTIGASTVVFGSFQDATLVSSSPYSKPTGVDVSPLYNNSMTLALNLSSYVNDINSIIATIPIPEASHYALIFASFTLLVLLVRRSKR